MKAGVTRRTLLLALALLPASAGLAYGDGDDDDDDDDDDHDRASSDVLQGRARPLSEILSMVRARLCGEVIGVKFKRKNGRQLYKLKLVTPTGQLREVSVDAMTGQIVQSEDD
jgi:uncharacterized membrane protein YkoI